MNRLIDGEACHFHKVVVIETPDHHRVQFDGSQTCRSCGLDSRKNFFQIGKTHDLADSFSFEGIQVDIDPVETGTFQVFSQTGEQNPICGHGDVRLGGHCSHTADDFGEILAQCWLTTSNTELAESSRYCCFSHQSNLGSGQQFLLRKKLQTFERHAITATQIATIHHRDPHVIDDSAVAISGHCQIPFR